MESAIPHAGVRRSGAARDLPGQDDVAEPAIVLDGSPAEATHDDGLGLLRDRGLAAAGVAAVLLDPGLAPSAGPASPTVLWANESFARLTGHRAEDVVGQPLRLLEAPEGAPFDFDAVRAAMNPASGETPVTWRMLNRRADGGHIWCEYSLAQVRGADGDVQGWLALVTDVSDQVREAAGRDALVNQLSLARAALDMITVVSSLLNDIEYPFVLKEIVNAYQPEILGWAGFFLDDGTLHYAEGIGPSRVGLRTGHHRRRGGAVDALGDSRVPGESAGVEFATTFIDPLRDLLDGYAPGPIDFPLRTDYPSGTVSAWLSAQVRERAASVLGSAGGADGAGGTDGAGGADGSVPLAQVSAVPGRRKVLGLFVHLPPGDGSVGMTDQTRAALVGSLVDRVGVAIDTMRLYAREHQLAETLQRAMLPEQVEVPGLDVWTYYAPTADDAQVGGDWYDILQIDDEVSGLVIGDVVGHDIEAAATMGQLRSVVRSYAFELTSPGPVLERVDQLVVGMRVPRSASLVYGTLRRVTGPRTGQGSGEDSAPRPVRWRFEYSRAGHLPPLLVRAGTVTHLDGAGGALIGFGGRSRATAAETLQPGDTLVFYTDGLIERRDRSLRAGLAALVEACERITATDAAGIGEELLARLAEAPEDDVAVVVVRVPDPSSDGSATVMSPRSRRWLLPSEPASIGRARHAVLRTCQAWELENVANAELVVSELVANGVLHGWGHISLRLFDTGDGLRIEVEDSNPAPPVTTDGHANRLGGYGMQIVERLAEWGWRPSGTGKLVWAKIRTVPVVG